MPHTAVRDCWKLVEALKMNRSASRLVIFGVLTMLNGCCTSYHVFVRMEPQSNGSESVMNRSVAADVVAAAAQSVGRLDALDQWTDGTISASIVRRGREIVKVSINAEPTIVYFGWDWRTHVPPELLQSAVSAEFLKRYDKTLRFGQGMIPMSAVMPHISRRRNC